MVKKDIMGHWYQCVKTKCGEKIPLPDDAFSNGIGITVTCPQCDNVNLFQFSHAKTPCTKEEALSYLKIKQQIKDGEIQFIAYWEGKKP